MSTIRLRSIAIQRHLLAFGSIEFARIGAVEKLSIEQLHTDDGEYELEQQIHDQNVDHILQRADDAIEDGLQLWHTFNGFQRSQHSKHPQRLHGGQILAQRSASVATFGA